MAIYAPTPVTVAALWAARANPVALAAEWKKLKMAANGRQVVLPLLSGAEGTLRDALGNLSGVAWVKPGQFLPGGNRRPTRGLARVGKTARDRADGSAARRAASRAKRDAACQAAKGKAGQK